MSTLNLINLEQSTTLSFTMSGRQTVVLGTEYDSLTPREREVMAGVVAGRLNMQIASDFGTSEKTVKFHRGHVLRKMRAPPLALRMATRLETTQLET